MWSDSSVSVFIELVKNAPAIWNRLDTDYKNKCRKRHLWNEIVIELNEQCQRIFAPNVPTKPFTQADCIRKFNNLKTYYQSEYNKILKARQGGAGASKIKALQKSWKFKTMLDFLNKDHIKYDFVDIKQESVETEVPQDSIATQSSSETEEIVQNVSEPPTPTESEPKKRKAEATDEETEENSNMFQRVMKRLTLNSIQEQLDSDEAVGLLVTQDLKKLDEDLKAEAVPEIVGIMMEYRKKQLKRRNR